MIAGASLPGTPGHTIIGRDNLGAAGLRHSAHHEVTAAGGVIQRVGRQHTPDAADPASGRSYHPKIPFRPAYTEPLAVTTTPASGPAVRSKS
jgi:hypothetical protein